MSEVGEPVNIIAKINGDQLFFEVGEPVNIIAKINGDKLFLR